MWQWQPRSPATLPRCRRAQHSRRSTIRRPQHTTCSSRGAIRATPAAIVVDTCMAPPPPPTHGKPAWAATIQLRIFTRLQWPVDMCRAAPEMQAVIAIEVIITLITSIISSSRSRLDIIQTRTYKLNRLLAICHKGLSPWPHNILSNVLRETRVLIVIIVGVVLLNISNEMCTIKCLNWPDLPLVRVGRARQAYIVITVRSAMLARTFEEHTLKLHAGNIWRT